MDSTMLEARPIIPLINSGVNSIHLIQLSQRISRDKKISRSKSITLRVRQNNSKQKPEKLKPKSKRSENQETESKMKLLPQLKQLRMKESRKRPTLESMMLKQHLKHSRTLLLIGKDKPSMKPRTQINLLKLIKLSMTSPLKSITKQELEITLRENLLELMPPPRRQLKLKLKHRQWMHSSKNTIDSSKRLIQFR